MTNSEIDAAARHMLTETVLGHLQPGSDQWRTILAWRYPEATITDREYIAMRVVELIAERKGER
jgi:hypothetical protein